MKLNKLIAITLSLSALCALLPSSHAAPQIGKPAPDFTLPDLDGKKHTLSEYKGKIVVLEWINHGCPFVVKHYSSGNMQAVQKEATEKGIVWLSICSSAPGKEGHMSPDEAKKKSKEVGSAASAYLIDEKGEVGQMYGAKVTPEIYIIDKEGNLVYHGAIDSIKSTNPADIPKATNYVRKALEEILAGKPVSEPKTKAYGCSVKYAK